MRGPAASADWAALFGLVVIWGSSFALLKIATEAIDPIWVAALRLAIAAGGLWLVAGVTGRRPPPLTDRATWRAYALIGVLGGALPFFLFAAAAQTTDSTILAICNGGSPFFTALLAQAFVAGERLTRQRVLGVGLGFLGLLALVGTAALGGGEGSALGVAAGVLGAFFYGVGNVATKRAPVIDALTGSALFCLAGATTTCLAAAISAPPPFGAPPGAYWSVLALGVFSTGLGSLGFVWLIQRRGPMFVSFATYLAPLWATLVGLVLLAERLTWNAGIALALVVLGMIVCNRPAATAR